MELGVEPNLVVAELFDFEDMVVYYFEFENSLVVLDSDYVEYFGNFDVKLFDFMV